MEGVHGGLSGPWTIIDSSSVNHLMYADDLVLVAPA